MTIPPTSQPSLLFYCQHSLGIGHLARSYALAAALATKFSVVLLCGGRLPEGVPGPAGVEVVALPPIGADSTGGLVSLDEAYDLDAAQEKRKAMILRAFRELRPAVVLVEFFPFGKKRFAGELLPLLAEARAVVPRPVVACSVRDILVGRGHGQTVFDDRASRIADDYLDAVLVHADPGFARFEESFRPSVPMRTPIHHTGFVVPAGRSYDVPPARDAYGSIVVSAGGGVAGAPLLRTAVDAYELLPSVPMKVITGPFLPTEDWRALERRTAGHEGVELVRSVPDLVAELRTARVSVSQCGYNTALDIVRAKVPALVVPYAERDEDEQTNRALRLERLGAVRMLEPSALSPAGLASAIGRTLDDGPVRTVPLDLTGAETTVRVLTELCEKREGAKACAGWIR